MTGSLASVHPELIPEWSEKNLPLTPDKITFGSNKRVWWKGACGHEWETSVKARSKGEKCPICSGARVIEGINDLATLKPLLAQEWSKKNKLKPTEVSVASHKKIIWKCKHGHEWEASVKSRTVNGTGCPYCSHNKVLDDEDIEMQKHDFITLYQGADYYGLGLKVFTRMAREAGSVYKIGKKALIRRTIFDEYLRKVYKKELEKNSSDDSGKELMKRQGTMVTDEDSGRMDIRFGLLDYYGGLHCGECLRAKVSR